MIKSASFSTKKIIGMCMPISTMKNKLGKTKYHSLSYWFIVLRISPFRLELGYAARPRIDVLR